MDMSDLDSYLIHGSLDVLESPTHPHPNGISIGSAVIAQHIRVTNTQTDRPHYMRNLSQ